MTTSSVIVPICGFISDVRIDVTRTPAQYRIQQRDAYQGLQHGGSWRHRIPEQYSGATRAVDEIQPRLRYWDSNSVGTTRLPVGFMRGVRDLNEAECAFFDTDHGRAVVTVWPTGTGAVWFHLPGREQSSESWARFAAERHETVSGVAHEIADQYLKLLVDEAHPLARLETSNGESSSQPPDTVGTNWLLLASGPVSQSSKAAVSHFMSTTEEGARNCWPNMSRYCALSNTYNVEIANGCDPEASQVLPVLVYNAYWVATLAHFDDDLAAAYTLMTAGVNVEDFDYRVVERSAHEMIFDHRDVLNAMSAPHFEMWMEKIKNWRQQELEDDIREKLTTIATLSQSQQLDHANELANRSNFVVTLLTALTLVGIVTGVAAFIFLEGEAKDLSPAIRVSLVAVAMLVSVVVFVIAVKPALERWRDEARATDVS